LQENLLTLASFDDKHALIIRNTVDPGLFGGQYRELAIRVFDFIDKYKKAPKDHLADLLIDKLESDNKREVTFYTDLLISLKDASEHVNPEYIVNQLDTFLKRQALRTVAVDLAKLLQRDTEESLEEADALIQKSRQSALKLFDPGLRLSNTTEALNFLERDRNSFPTGIKELDKRGFGPTRKEMWLFIADTKKGKSWALVHLAKMASTHRLKVLHISLENSRDITAQRYFQTFFAMSKRKEKIRLTKFQQDSLGRITGFDEKHVTPKLSLDDPYIKEKLERKIQQWSSRVFDNIIVKDFPTGMLTMPQLEAYMDNLEQQERFVPDLLVLDYPDLMKIDKENYRLSLDEIYKDVRGVLVKRNIAGAVVTQSNRKGGESKTVGRSNVAEAYSKIAHADTVVTYSQTMAEKQLNLARLTVEAGRNDQDGMTLVISQQYGIGGFALDSTLLTGNYWNSIPRGGSDDD